MAGKCNHTLQKFYYRKRIKGKKEAQWMTIPNKYYCNKCKEIIEVNN